MDFSTIPHNFPQLEQWVNRRQSHRVKNSARAQIIWHKPSQKVKTATSLLYLHGFKASHGEGAPVHKNIAQKLNANTYLTRLSGHGLKDSAPFSNFKAENLIQSGLEALEIAKRIGNRVIIMGTSTGASLALYLAGCSASKNHIHSLILYSPLIDFYGMKSYLLNNKIGRRILTTFPGKNYIIKNHIEDPAERAIWYSSYCLQGVLELAQFINTHINEKLFKQLSLPIFVGYYRKNFWEKDKIVSTREIKKMFNSLGTPIGKKKIKNFPNAQTHVIANGLLSKCVKEVEQETRTFLREIAKK